jgi:N-acetylneuraminic acid mutarotase
MTSLPDGRRPAVTWIVIGMVAVLAVVATLLTINLLSRLPTGTGPTATESLVASATSGPSATPLFLSSASSTASASPTPDEHTAPAWAATGGMIEARAGQTATLLPDGTVLVAGGSSIISSIGSLLASAELYDPSSGSWTATRSMIEARAGHTATLLPDGRVLVAGGGIISSIGSLLASAELYDPSSGSWTRADGMIEARDGHTATLLPNGQVIVAGGYGSIGSLLASAELYNPSSGSWTATGSMIEAPYGHTATLLPNGAVLAAGGCCDDPSTGHQLAPTELYDPESGSWTATGNMHEGRAAHTAALLADGTVLVAGGSLQGTAVPSASAELYDPGSGTWTATAGMFEARTGHTATLLPNGKVLVTGGYGGSRSSGTLASAELYDPGNGI